MQNAPFPQLSPTVLSQYAGFREAALEAAEHFDGSKKSSDRLAKILDAISALAKRDLKINPLTKNAEDQFVQAAEAQCGRIKYNIVSLDSFRDMAVQRVEEVLYNPEQADNAFFDWLEKTGAVVEDVYGCFVLPDKKTLSEKSEQEDMPERESKTIRFEPKTKQVVLRLLRMGFSMSDLKFSRGRIFDGMWRKKPYILINIPRIGKQIAVCDQIGQTFFISNSILPIDVWAGQFRSALMSMAGITTVPYDALGKWLSKMQEILLDAGRTVPGKQPKVKIQRAPKPSLTIPQIAEWYESYYQHELATTGLEPFRIRLA